MKIVFFGTPPPAVPALFALIDAGHEIPLVVTQPDRPIGRSRTPVHTPVKVAAMDRGIPVVQRPPLARALYRQVDVGQEVPPDFYKAVAEILAFVYQLNNRMAG